MTSYKVGDVVFWRLGPTAGEGMFIGHLKRDTAVLVMVVQGSGVEIDAADCSPTGRGEPPLGAAERQAYLKLHPGSLK